MVGSDLEAWKGGNSFSHRFLWGLKGTLGTTTPLRESRTNAIWGSRGGVWGGVVGGCLEVGRLDAGSWVVGGVGGWKNQL